MTTASGESASAQNSNEGIQVEMNLIDARGVGVSIGSVHISDGKDGLVVTPDLSGLPPGSHGFHLHQNPDCGAAMTNGNARVGWAGFICPRGNNGNGGHKQRAHPA